MRRLGGRAFHVSTPSVPGNSTSALRVTVASRANGSTILRCVSKGLVVRRNGRCRIVAGSPHCSLRLTIGSC